MEEYFTKLKTYNVSKLLTGTVYRTQFSFFLNCDVFHVQRKIELLEQKLLEEEHERKLVQEKAEEVKQNKKIYESC